MAPPKRSVLITGCSDGGLGAAIALEMHRSGRWRVLASARNVKKMASLSSAGIETLSLDVLSEESLQAAITHITELLGGTLDGLLLNAGGGYSMPITDISLPAMRSMYELNVFSPIRTIQLFLPLLLASKNSPTIMVNTSCAALPPVGNLPWMAAYNSSKSAMMSLIESLRFEMSPFDISVVEIRTGNVKSKFFENIAAKTTASEAVAELPPNSLYAAARDDLEPFMSGALMEKDGQDQARYARNVVKDLNGGWFGGAPDVVTRGTFASTVNIVAGIHGLLPTWFLRYLVRDVGMVNTVEKKVRAARAGKKA